MSQRRIFTTDPNDLIAGVLAELGQDNDAIRRETGLSDGKIAYRLRWVGITRRGPLGYRNGQTAAAKLVRSLAEDRIETLVTKQVAAAAKRTNGRRR